MTTNHDVELCEEPRWDSGASKACKYMGFRHCSLLDKPIYEDIMGWRTCCKDCPHPYRTLDGDAYFNP
jgi:hypothetical protein